MADKTRCIIISGGKESRLPVVTADDYVIACDRGYTYALRQGVRPDLLISDFDSYRGAVDEQIPVEAHEPEKDDTDTMLAVKKALALGFRQIEIYCAFGGRLDHLCANLQTAVYAATRGARCTLKDEDNQVFAMTPGQVRLTPPPGFSLSLFAETDRCTGVTLRGVKYPLTDATLTNDFPLGVSNECTDAQGAHLELKQGILLVMFSRLAAVAERQESEIARKED